MYNMTGRIITIFVVALIWVEMGIAQVSASTTSFPGVINTIDPCTKKTVTARGTTTLSITMATEGNGVIVEEHFVGSGNGYDVTYHGRKKFSTSASSYDIPIEGEWDGRKEFTSKGIDRISTSGDGVTPTGDVIQSLKNKCDD
jgi:hypothetical protein